MERHLSKLAVIQRENERWAEKRRLLLQRLGKEVDMVQECGMSRQPAVEISLDETFRIIFMPEEEENRREAARMSSILEESQATSALLAESQGISALLEKSQEATALLEELQERGLLEEPQEHGVLEESQEMSTVPESEVVEEEPLTNIDQVNQETKDLFDW